MGAEPFAPKSTNEGNNRGEEGKDDICDLGSYVEKLEISDVPKNGKEKSTSRDYQSAINSN